MKQLLRRKETLLRRMRDCSGYLRGSITSVCSTCNRAKCICSTTTTKKAYRLTYKTADQKSRTVYIPRDQIKDVKKKIRDYAQFRKLMNDLLDINVALFKSQSGK